MFSLDGGEAQQPGFSTAVGVDLNTFCIRTPLVVVALARELALPGERA